MNLSNITPASGSTKKRKRVGRGEGSGHGGTSTRGHKGAKSRSGYSSKIGFEGGQMPMYRRMPKRGFTNIFAKNWAEVNVDMLQRFFKADDVVSLETLRGVGLAAKKHDGVRILGRGELNIALKVEVAHVTAGAKKKIEEAGGSVAE